MSHRILVVEDDPTLRLVLQDNLRSEGYDVDVVADGVSGVISRHGGPPQRIAPCGLGLS
jgi:DNA-binding response OmpR family regulator